MVEKSILFEKALKLYNLTASSNENESNVAQSMLDRFLKKHKLTLDQILDHQFIDFELVCEDKYEMYLFNHLLLKSLENSDILKKIRVRQVSEVKCEYRLNKYVHSSITAKYKKILQTYKITKQSLQKKLELDKERSKIQQTTSINFGGFVINLSDFYEEESIEFNENLFFISFIKKYDLIPKPQEGQQKEAKPLTEQEVTIILKMEKMYRKESFNEELTSNMKSIKDSFE